MVAFDYTNRDYTNIKTSLLRRASRVVPDWTARDAADFGMLMVDLWSQMGDVLHHYVDRAAGEAFLPTATQRESVLAYAALLGYRPSGRTSALGTVTLANSLASEVTIPANTSFVARDGDKLFYFYVPVATVIPAGSTGTSVGVAEGVVVLDETLTTSATGKADQRYTLAFKDVVETSVKVVVYEDGITPTKYHRVDSLLNAGVGEKAFRIKHNASEFAEVVFGSYLFGAIPQSGVTVKASYVYSSGALGNISANSIFGFTTTAPTGISIVSSSAMNGGTNSEPISALRKSIPANFVPQGRAVTLADYVTLAKQSSGVAKATGFYTGASAGNASVTVLPHEDRTADFLSSTDTSQAVSSEVSSEVISTLSTKKMIGVDVVCASSISWEQIYFEVDVYASDYSYSNDVEAAVESVLSEVFSFSNVYFGQTFTLSKLYRVILGITGVDYAIITKFNNVGDTSVLDSFTVDSLSLPKVTFGSPSSDTLIVTVNGGIAP